MTAEKIINLCGVCGMPCGIQCGVKSLIHMACAVCAVSSLTRAHTYKTTQPHTRTTKPKTSHVCDTAHTAHTAHPLFIKHLHACHTAHPYPTYRTKKMNDGKDSKRVIRCTPENAKAMAGVVKNWPELHSLVQSLQAQDLFPGLRNMQITLTGSAAFTAKGLDAVNEINATKAV